MDEARIEQAIREVCAFLELPERSENLMPFCINFSPMTFFSKSFPYRPFDNMISSCNPTHCISIALS